MPHGSIVCFEESLRTPLQRSEVTLELKSFGTPLPTGVGPVLRFSKKMQEMRAFLNSTDHLDAHRGLEILGRCFRFLRTLRPTTQGAPDVAWLDVQQASQPSRPKLISNPPGLYSKKTCKKPKVIRNGYATLRSWMRRTRSQSQSSVQRRPLDDAAKPFAANLYVVSPQAVRDLAESAIKGVSELRTMFLGREFTEARVEFEHEMGVKNLLRGTPSMTCSCCRNSKAAANRRRIPKQNHTPKKPAKSRHPTRYN